MRYRGGSMSLDKTWHLATSDEEIKITEFELLLWRVTAAFFRWQEECEKVANGNEFSADELAVLHVIRMKDRPKTIAEIGRLLNRDSFFNINYNIAKLIKQGLVKKLTTGSKKQHQYIVTEEGKNNTENYTETRRSILINEFKKDLNALNLKEITNGLMRLKSIYEEGVRMASSYQPNINKKISNKIPTKKTK